MSHQVRSNLQVLGNTDLKNTIIDGILYINNGAFTDIAISADVNGKITITDESGTIVLEDLAQAMHDHTNKAILDATDASFTTTLETNIGNAVTHISDTANPHDTSLANLNTGLLSDLNALVTDLMTTYGGIRDIGIGALADRPSANDATKFWWATDYQILYRANGTLWETIKADPVSHSGLHITGNDDAIQLATNSQDGLMSQAYAGKLDNLVENPRYTDNNVGNGVNNPITINHGLGQVYVQVLIMDNATGQVVTADVTLTDANNISIDFGTAPAIDAYTVKVFA